MTAVMRVIVKKISNFMWRVAQLVERQLLPENASRIRVIAINDSLPYSPEMRVQISLRYTKILGTGDW